MKKFIFLTVILCLSIAFYTDIKASDVFYGKVTTDNINVRSDSNINSQIICSVKKSDVIEVISEKYNWYKIKLPKTAPAFVKKDLISSIDLKTAKALKDNTNIRLMPNTSSAILGTINKNEILNILEDNGEWYKIEPTDNCFGWIHNKFIEKTADKVIPENKACIPQTAVVTVNPQSPDLSQTQDILIEGIIQPYGKVINRIATHKIITKDYDIFLLKGNPDNLNTFTYHKVKITGKLLPVQKQKYPVIEVVKMEAID